MNHENRFILFHVGGEVYGTPLLDVREVLEYQTPKHMPNMMKHFAGVINIRGSIVGVVDLRSIFDAKTENTRTTALLVSDTPQGSIAAVVDRVDSVVNIERELIDEKPPVFSSVNQEYLIGVAKMKDRLITLLKLHELLSNEKLVKISA